MGFKTLLTENQKEDVLESADGSEYGLHVYGDFIKLDIQEMKHNNLMEIVIKGDKAIPKLKSIETLKSEYEEKDWIALEKIYSKASQQYAKELDKLVSKFEKELQSTIKSFEKELSKY